jgi:hypothetical protein
VDREAPGNEDDGGLSDDEILGDPTRRLQAGIRVEVRSRFDQRWASGFEVVGVAPDGYILRRLSDGDELPVHFARSEVRRERRSSGNWWF